MSSPTTAPSHVQWLSLHGAVLDDTAYSVLHFGDPTTELKAFSQSAALVHRSQSAAVIAQEGADALDLLHRLSTNDLLSLRPGQSAGTVLTSERGRIIDVLQVAVIEEGKLLLLSDAADGSKAVDWIERFTIIEDSAARDATAEFGRFTVIGPSAAEVVSQALGPEPGSNGAVLVTSTWGDLSRIEVLVEPGSEEETWNSFVASGAVPAGQMAFETARISRGLPVAGAELTADFNPLEAGLKHLVSFTKGCYIGQEVVARLDTYDKLQRRLVKFESDSPLKSGAQLTSDGKRAGTITSVSPLEVNGAHPALGYARREFWSEGTRLECEGAAVTVHEIPETGP